VKVRRFQAGDAEPIARLNARLRARNVPDVVWPEGAHQEIESSVRERLFVAEDSGEVRGAVWLKEQVFRIRGRDVVCGWLKYPIAESLIDPRYSGVPGSLIVQCLREQPRLFALGLGGHETPLARMLKALRWTGTTVPMLVRLVHPARSLRQLAPLRRTGPRRAAADGLAFTGAAWLALRALDLVRRARSPRPAHGYAAEAYDQLGSWADDIWLRCRDRYEFVAGRDPATVESMLPVSPDIVRLRIRRGAETVGWACVLRHDFSVGKADPNFGRLTVGLIADALSTPEDAAPVMRCAHDFLVAGGADIIVSNQLHPIWADGLRRVGFVDAPSNFAFYASPGAAQVVVPWNECHVNRGDCDGPLWYETEISRRAYTGEERRSRPASEAAAAGPA
jgi:hypothetical protein